MRAAGIRWLAAACCAVLLAAVVAATAAGTSSAADRRVDSRVTIDAWPEGLFGYVKSPSPARCAKGRRVTVFKRAGRGRHPGRDARIGTVKARRNHGFFQWSLETGKAGRFYAKARKRPGCRAALSTTIRSRPDDETGSGAGDDDYPPCSPWVSEGTSAVCRIEMLRFGISGRNCGGFSDTTGTCYGKVDEGPFPWGRTPTGQLADAGFYWNWNNKSVLFVAYKPGQEPGMAHLGGTMPWAGSANFTVGDGFAQNDRGYPNGDHFYTPNLPGQNAGEVGGPLYLDFSYRSSVSTVKIHGYLYLKR